MNRGGLTWLPYQGQNDEAVPGVFVQQVAVIAVWSALAKALVKPPVAAAKSFCVARYRLNDDLVGRPLIEYFLDRSDKVGKVEADWCSCGHL